MYSINYFETMGKKYSQASGSLAQFQKPAQLPYKESPIEIAYQRTVSKLKVIDLPGAGRFRNVSQDALFTLSPSEGKGCHGLGDELGWRSKRSLKHWHQARLLPVDFRHVWKTAHHLRVSRNTKTHGPAGTCPVVMTVVISLPLLITLRP